MKLYRKVFDAFSSNIISKNNLEITLGEFVGALILSLVFGSFFLLSNAFWIFAVLMIPVLLFGYHKNSQLNQQQQKFLTSLTLAVILTYSLRIILAVYKGVLAPPEWDFHLYWLYGQVGSRFLSPYETDNLLRFAQVLNPNDAFLTEMYFFQTPPLIFLFIPLGWSDLNTAAFLWGIFLIIVLIFDVILLWSIFYDRTDYKNLLLVTVLTLMLSPVLITLEHSQINFIVLLTFLLYWHRRESLMGGVWLGVGIIVKPVLIIVLIYPVLKRHWQTFLGISIAIAALSAVTIVVFGPEMFIGYFSNNPIVHSMPKYMYVEDIAQSLLATILRLTNFDFSEGSPYLQPIFIATAMLITGATSFLIIGKKDEEKDYSDYALALTITFALLLFPRTLTHYAVLLIVPIMLVWANRKRITSYFWLILGFITMEYVLLSLEGNFVFISILMAWLYTAGVCIKTLLTPTKSIRQEG